MQFSDRVVLTFILTCFYQLPGNVYSQYEITAFKTENATKYNFSKLLNSIITINKQRLEALKKYNELDRTILSRGVLRGEDDRSYLDPMVAVLFVNKNISNSKVYEIFDSDVINTHGKTPVRNILKRLKDHYNQNPDEYKNEILNTEDNDLNQNLLYATKIHSTIEGIDITDEVEIIPKRDTKKFNKLVAGENIAINSIKRMGQASNEEEDSISSKKYISLKEMPDGEVIIRVKDKPKHRTNLTKVINHTERIDETTTIKYHAKNDSNKNTTSDKELSDNEIFIKGNEKIKLTNNLLGDKKQILRLFKSCSRGMIRRCKSACKKAYKASCDTYMCSRGLKRTMAKYCKSKCKGAFNDD